MLVCVCVPKTEPTKAGAGCVWGSVATSVPVAAPTAENPVVAVAAMAATVPAGVPADAAEVVTDEPMKTGAATVPAGVMVSDPPVVPTLPLAKSVPSSVFPFKAATSVYPVEHAERVSRIAPDGTAATLPYWVVMVIRSTGIDPMATV